VPVGPGTTRLLLKVVTRGGRLVAPVVSVGDLVMARRQLRNLATLAEGPGVTRRAPMSCRPPGGLT
jgi:hypothetical protein